MKNMNARTMVANYLRLREYKDAATAEFKKEMERVNQAVKVLETNLLRHFSEEGTDQARCAEGTAYTVRRTSASVADRDTFLEWVIENEQWEALDVKANKTFVDAASQKGVDVPGVKLTTALTVNVRRGK